MNLSEVVTAVADLSKISSSNEKIAYLKNCVASNSVRDAFFYTLNPELNYFVVPDPKWTGKGEKIDFSDVYFNVFADRRITGNAAKEKMQALIEACTPQCGEILLRIFDRDLRCGVAEGTVNKVWKKLIPEFGVMLADQSEDFKGNLDGWYAEAKYDGLRCIATVLEDGEVLFQSRNGKPLYNIEAIGEEIRSLALPSGTRLDGEIYDKDWNFTAQLVRSSKTNRKSSTAKLIVFDYLTIIDWETPTTTFDTRKRLLYEMVWQRARNAKIELRWLMPPLSYGALPDAASRAEAGADALAKGFEGLILKDPFAKYERKRSKAWLKVKPKETVDATIIGVEEGKPKSKYVGKLGAFICMFPDDTVGDRTFNVGSGFSDEQRQDFWNRAGEMIGKTIEVEADAMPPSAREKIVIRFPVFLRFREDK